MLACRLRQDSGSGTGCYIGVNESNAFFRVERTGVCKTAVALKVSPELEGGERLIFRVHAVTIIDTSVHIAPAGVVPVSYDSSRNQFTMETVPPVEEPHMAEFFLARAERALDEPLKRNVRDQSHH